MRDYPFFFFSISHLIFASIYYNGSLESDYAHKITISGGIAVRSSRRSNFDPIQEVRKECHNELRPTESFLGLMIDETSFCAAPASSDNNDSLRYK